MPSLIYALKAVRSPYTLPLGPEVLNLSLSTGDSAVSAGTAVTLNAIANDTRYNNSRGAEPTQNISQSEYYIDKAPWETGSSAIAMNASDSSYDSSVESITQTIDTSSLSEGNHTIFVRAKDEDNNWGVVSAIFLRISKDDTPVKKSEITSPTKNEKVAAGSYTFRWKNNGATKQRLYVGINVNGKWKNFFYEYVTDTSHEVTLPSGFTRGLVALFSYNGDKDIGIDIVDFSSINK